MYIVKSTVALTLAKKLVCLADALILLVRSSKSLKVFLQSASEMALWYHISSSIDANDNGCPRHSFSVLSTASRKLISVDNSVQSADTRTSALLNVETNSWRVPDTYIEQAYQSSSIDSGRRGRLTTRAACISVMVDAVMESGSIVAK